MRKIDHQECTIALEEITPDDARTYLATNNNIRKLLAKRVKSYAKSMRSGEWVWELFDPVRFRSDGSLMDGQHRLMSIVESGTSGHFLVIRMRREIDEKPLDTGRARLAADYLSSRGIANATKVGAASKKVIEHALASIMGLSMSQVTNTQFMPPEMVADLGSSDQEPGRVIRRWTKRVGRAQSRTRIANGTLVVACIVLDKFAPSNEFCSPDIFLDTLEDRSDAGMRHPCVSLRRQLDKEERQNKNETKKQHRLRFGSDHHWKMVSRTLKAMVVGEELDIIRPSKKEGAVPFVFSAEMCQWLCDNWTDHDGESVLMKHVQA